MSVLDQIKELEAQKKKLLADAKKEAMAKAHAAISELNSLGFNYSLSEGATTVTTGKRRSGIRTDVLAVVEKNTDGIARADILETMGVKGDKSGEQSVSNALSALKKAGTIGLNDGLYTPS